MYQDSVMTSGSITQTPVSILAVVASEHAQGIQRIVSHTAPAHARSAFD
jgi:hypothetical protein